MKKKNQNANEIEYEQKTGDYSVSRNKKFDWIVLIFCVIVAFFIWAYALNITDPIIEKEVEINYNLVGLERNGIIFEFDTVLVYGPSSLLESLNTIEVEVNKAELYNKNEIDKRIKYPSRIKPVDDDKKTVNIRFAENNDADN